jgi:hypothetical protein
MLSSDGHTYIARNNETGSHANTPLFLPVDMYVVISCFIIVFNQSEFFKAVNEQIT